MKFYILILLTTSFLMPYSVFGKSELKPFFTDGCTLFVDGPSKENPKLWRACCVKHDLRYWFGGSLFDQEQTDLKLKSCVKDIAGERWATLIYTGVRAGHYSPIKNKTYWGWAWTPERLNKAINATEKSYVLSELRKLNLTQESVNITDFIKDEFKE